MELYKTNNQKQKLMNVQVTLKKPRTTYDYKNLAFSIEQHMVCAPPTSSCALIHVECCAQGVFDQILKRICRLHSNRALIH